MSIQSLTCTNAVFLFGPHILHFALSSRVQWKGNKNTDYSEKKKKKKRFGIIVGYLFLVGWRILKTPSCERINF